MDEAGNKVTATLRLVAEYANEREDPISVTVQLGRVQSTEQANDQTELDEEEERNDQQAITRRDLGRPRTV